MMTFEISEDLIKRFTRLPLFTKDRLATRTLIELLTAASTVVYKPLIQDRMLSVTNILILTETSDLEYFNI